MQTERGLQNSFQRVSINDTLMRKAVKRKVSKAETLAIPDAENAKWLAFGFLASAVIVGIVVLMIIQAHAH